MKKLRIILLITMGFLLMPSVTFACGSGKYSCKKEISDKKRKDCCSKAGHSKSSEGCGSKCGHKSCGCTSACISGIALVQSLEFIGFTNSPYFFKPNFHYPKNIISSGFYSLWLIPKIS